MATIESLDFDAVGGPLLTYECGKCGKEREARLSALVLGDDGCENADSILLPSCDCGCVDYLLQSWTEDAAHDSPARRAVNAVATYLADREQVAPRHAARAKAAGRPKLAGKTRGRVADLRGKRRAKREQEDGAAIQEVLMAAHEAFVQRAEKLNAERAERVRARAKTKTKKSRDQDLQASEFADADKELRAQGDAPPSKADYHEAMALARRAAVVKVRANRKAGRAAGAEASAAEIAAADAELTAELNAAAGG